MTPEEIVRALAAAEPLGYDCANCGHMLRGDQPDRCQHAPWCPWRLAVEWVEANPETRS